MHPEICHFVSEQSYDGRLASAGGCELQGVSSSGLTGAGLPYIAVDHRHNAGGEEIVEGVDVSRHAGDEATYRVAVNEPREAAVAG